MINFDQMDEALLLARGQYATVRGSHEDCKRELQILCGELSSVAQRILKRMQPDRDAIPDPVDELLNSARAIINSMESKAAEIEQLATQRKQIKPIAWPKG